MKTLVDTQRDTGETSSGDSLRIGMRAGPWVIERELGRGGMGVVYAVRHAQIGKRAALKVMHRRSSDARLDAHRMQLEAQVVNAIGHPNIVDIFDVGTTADGRPYIVMEQLAGCSLAECDPPADEALWILIQVSEALIAAHAAGVVHRDLKPENILVAATAGATPRVVVLDWGIARMLNADSHYTLDGHLVGTPRYIAPEQARGEPVTTQTDVYSLGVVAYELVLLQPPFEAETATEMMAMHLFMPPRSPQALWPEIPPRLAALMLEMLAKAPAERPTMVEVSERLEQIREELRQQRRKPPALIVTDPELETPWFTPAIEPAPELETTRWSGGSTATWQLVLGALAVAAACAVVAIAIRGDAPRLRTIAQPASAAPSPQRTPALANPVLEDCADPSVLRDITRWYMTCSGGSGDNLYGIYESADLQSWHRVGWIFPAGARRPAWASGASWSPELHRTPDGYAAYFSVRVDGVRNAIGVATARAITGPYLDRSEPLLAPPQGASDATVLVDHDQRYLYFRSEDHPPSIAVQEVSADGVTAVGKATRLLIGTQPWERDNVGAPWVIHEGDYYYLFYSAARTCDVHHATGVARSRSPLGPFEKLALPIIKTTADWAAPGHPSITELPSGERYLVTHAYRVAEGMPSCDGGAPHRNTRRHVRLDRVVFANGWPHVTERR